MTAATRKKDKGRRSEIEAELRDTYGVQFTYHPDVPTSEFDIDRSLKNQARFEPLDESVVATYQEAVERGDAFPAVIAYRPGRGRDPKLAAVDGNHRLVAHDRAGQPIDVYEVERGTNAKTIALMTFAFNTKHGLPTSEQERLSQALYLMDNGASMKEAAARLSVRMSDLQRAANRAKGDKRAADAGVDPREWESLQSASRTRLLGVSTDEGFAGAAHLSYAARLGTDEVQDLVALLNGAGRSATKQRQIIKSETERHADRIQEAAGGTYNPKGRKAMTHKGRVQMILGQFVAIPDDIETVASSFADAERGDTAKRLIQTSKKMRKLALALDPSVR